MGVFPALQIKPPDPYGPLKQWADIQKTGADINLTRAQTATEQQRPALLGAETQERQAHAGLLGAQTTKEQIANQLQVLLFGQKMAGFNFLLGGAGGGSEGSSYGQPSASGTGHSLVPKGGTYPDGATGKDLLSQNVAPDGTSPNALASIDPSSITATAPATAANPVIDVIGRELAQPEGQDAPNVLARLRSDNPDMVALGPDYRAQLPANQTERPVEVPANATLPPNPPGSQITMGPDGSAPAPVQLAQNVPPGGGGAGIPGISLPPGMTITMPAGPMGPAREIPVGAPQGGGQPGGALTPPEMKLSPNGAFMPGLGAVPKQLAYQVATTLLNGGDVTKATEAVYNMKRQRLGQLAAGAHDVASWDQAVNQGWSEGLLTGPERDQLYGPGGYQRRAGFLASLTSPETQQSTANTAMGQGMRMTPEGPVVDPSLHIGKPPIQATTMVNGRPTPVIIPADAWVAGRVAAAGGKPPDGTVAVTTQQPGVDSQGNVQNYSVTKYVPQGALGQPGAAGGAGGGQSSTAPGDPSWQSYQRQSLSDEGGPGRNRAGSSAEGYYQWTDGTWLDQMHRNFPQIAAGRSDAELLALRGNRSLEDAAFAKFTGENAAALQQRGYPVNASSLRLAHWFGIDGMTKVMNAPANAPLGSLVPGRTLAMNGIDPDTRVGDLARFVTERFGKQAVNIPGGGAGQPGTMVAGPGGGPGGAPPQPPGQATTSPGALPPGTLYGAPEYTPDQKVAVEAENEQLKKDSDYVGELQGAQRQASNAQTQLINFRDTARDLPTGAFADQRAHVARVMASFFPQSLQDGMIARFMKATAGIDPNDAARWDELNKQALAIAGQAETQVAGSRGGFNLVRLYSKAFPGAETQPRAISDMVNMILVGHQFTIDHASSMNDAYQKGRGEFLANPTGAPYQPLSQTEASFLDQKGAHSPQVYVGAAAALNHRTDWAKGLDKAQQAEALRIARRADPNGSVLWSDGKTVIPFQRAQ